MARRAATVALAAPPLRLLAAFLVAVLLRLPQPGQWGHGHTHTTDLVVDAFVLRPSAVSPRTTARAATTSSHDDGTVSTSPSSSSTSSSSSASSSSSSAAASRQPQKQPHEQSQKHQPPQHHQHTLAILAMPATSWDRMVNDAILTHPSVQRARKLSVVLRCEGRQRPTTAALRRYVAQVYAQLWDALTDALEEEEQEEEQRHQQPPMDNQKTNSLLDVVVYPQNLPNAAPEAWLDIQPDLDCVCSHDCLTGWTSTSVGAGRGRRYQQHQGQGGVQAHVAALNRERAARGLPAVAAVVTPTLPVVDTQHVVFMEDDDGVESNVDFQMHRLEKELIQKEESLESGSENDGNNGAKPPVEANGTPTFLGGASQSTSQPSLFDHVTVGGTFDGLHFGHRKLLTLAVSSVTPLTGRLTVGVTVDAMLTHKAYADYLPPLDQRMQGVRDFLQRLAPGMMNRIKVIPITDAFGPPGQPDSAHFDALVLSHETLENGHLLNARRQSLGLPPLTLLCTLRTEAHGMSSTALRRKRYQHQKEKRLLGDSWSGSEDYDGTQ